MDDYHDHKSLGMMNQIEHSRNIQETETLEQEQAHDIAVKYDRNRKQLADNWTGRLVEQEWNIKVQKSCTE